MSAVNRYTPQVGDRVRRPWWEPGQWFDVTHVGRRLVVGDDEDGDEGAYEIDDAWWKVETLAPLPEWWVNLYPHGIGNGYPTPEEATGSTMADRIAVVHVWTDADGVDHAEIERATA